MKTAIKNRYQEKLESAERVSNARAWLDVYDAIADRISTDGTHIDVGHIKNFEFPLRMAKIFETMFPQKQFVYYDGTDPNPLERARLFLSGDVRKMKRRAPGKMIYTNDPAPYVNSADSVSHMFTIHEFDDPREALREAHSLLKKDDSRPDVGLDFIIDYDLNWVQDGLPPKQVAKNMLRVFKEDNEKRVADEESNWVAKHTKYSLAQCVADAEAVGFQTVETRVFGNKLFLYVGKK